MKAGAVAFVPVFVSEKIENFLEHLGDEAVHESLTVTTLATLVETLTLLGLAALGRAQLEWPQEVVGLTEVRADSVNLVNEVLHAVDAVLAKATLDDSVVEEREALLVDLTEATLVDQVADRLEARVTVREVRLDTGEHLGGRLGGLHEDTHVHLAKTHDLEDLLGLRVEVGETADADDEDELGLSIHVVVAGSLGLAVHAHTLGRESAVLLNILGSIVVGSNALLLAGLLGLSVGGSGSLSEGVLGLLLLEQDNVGLADHRARDGEALPLPAREVLAAVRDERHELVGAVLHELPRARVLERAHDLLVAHVVEAVRDVVADRGVEEHGVLVDDHAARAQEVHVVLGERHVVEQDRAARRLVQPLQQAHAAALAAAGAADERDLLPGLDDEREAVEHGLARVGRVREVHVAELDLAAEARRPQPAREDGAHGEREELRALDRRRRALARGVLRRVRLLRRRHRP